MPVLALGGSICLNVSLFQDGEIPGENLEGWLELPIEGIGTWLGCGDPPYNQAKFAGYCPREVFAAVSRPLALLMLPLILTIGRCVCSDKSTVDVSGTCPSRPSEGFAHL